MVSDPKGGNCFFRGKKKKKKVINAKKDLSELFPLTNLKHN